MAVPFEVMSATLPSRTCVRKYGLYGTRTRSGPFVAREPNQKLTISSPTTSASSCQLTRKRGFGLGAGDEGGGVLIGSPCQLRGRNAPRAPPSSQRAPYAAGTSRSY